MKKAIFLTICLVALVSFIYGFPENDNYIDLIQLEIDVKRSSTKTYGNLNDTEKGILDAVATSDTRSAIKAQLILKTFYAVDYEKLFPVLIGSSYKRIESEALRTTFSIYPNPTKNSVVLQYPPSEQQLTCSVFDLTGKVILTEKVNSNGHHELNISDVSSGIYIVRLEALEQSNANQRLIILK